MGTLLLLCGFLALAAGKPAISPSVPATSSRAPPMTSAETTTPVPPSTAEESTGSSPAPLLTDVASEMSPSEGPSDRTPIFMINPSLLMRPGSRFYYHVPIAPDAGPRDYPSSFWPVSPFRRPMQDGFVPTDHEAADVAPPSGDNDAAPSDDKSDAKEEHPDEAEPEERKEPEPEAKEAEMPAETNVQPMAQEEEPRDPMPAEESFPETPQGEGAEEEGESFGGDEGGPPAEEDDQRFPMGQQGPETEPMEEQDETGMQEEERGMEGPMEEPERRREEGAEEERENPRPWGPVPSQRFEPQGPFVFPQGQSQDALAGQWFFGEMMPPSDNYRDYVPMSNMVENEMEMMRGNKAEGP